MLSARNKRTIEARLTQAKQQRELESYTKDFGARYQTKTTCADGYRIAECRNPPAVKTATETTPATAPDTSSGPPSANGQPNR